jgi:hypothetical protein
MASLRSRSRPDDDEDERPRKRRARESSSATLWIVLGSCGGGLLLIGIIVAIVLSNNDKPDKSDGDPNRMARVNGPNGNFQAEFPGDFNDLQKNFPKDVGKQFPKDFGKDMGKQFPKDFGKDLGKQIPKDFGKDFGKDFPIDLGKREPEDPDPINRALKGLAGDVFSQGDAANSLEKMTVNQARRAEVVNALKKVIDNREPLIPRGECVRALGTWGGREEGPYLITLLDDQDGGVKENAITVLGRLKEDRAAGVLAGRLNDFFQRGRISQALKDMGPGAEAAVCQQLKNQDGGVRAEACRILKVIGTAASHAALIDACEDQDGGVATAAREALPEAQRPPIYGPKQTLTLNVHVVNNQAWPAIEARIKALADAPKAVCKVRPSGQYMWVTLAPVNGDADAFSRRINFGKVTAIHKDQRLIYVESGQ